MSNYSPTTLTVRHQGRLWMPLNIRPCLTLTLSPKCLGFTYPCQPNFLQNLTAGGFVTTPDEDPLDETYLRSTMVSLMCGSGFEPCLTKAAEELTKWKQLPKADPNPIDLNLRSQVRMDYSFIDIIIDLLGIGNCHYSITLD